MDAKDIRKAFQARGVDVGRPIRESQLSRLDTDLQIAMDPYLRSIFREFDGFESFDDRTLICLWSFNRIIAEKDDSVVVHSERYFPVGDLLIDSDFVMCCLERATAPVFLLAENRQLAPTVDEFFQKFIAGAFDLDLRPRATGAS